MPLNTTTNLKLSITASTVNSSCTIAGLSVKQEFKTKKKNTGRASFNISNGIITKSNLTSVSGGRTGIGTTNEKTIMTITGIIPYNKNVAVAEITITPDANFKLSKTPSISFDTPVFSNQIIVKNFGIFLEKTPTKNKFNVICNAPGLVSSTQLVSLKLDYSVAKISPVTTNTISQIYCGNSIIKRQGEKRSIKIYGSPNTPFDLTVLDSNNKSIIRNSNTTSVLPVGVTQSLSANLNSKGYYIHKQFFPKIPTVKVTTVNGSMAASGATRVIFTSLSGVQVGDEIIVSNSNGTRYSNGETIKVLVLNPTGGNANECDLSKSIVAADGAGVSFKRSTSFKLNIETSGTKGSSIESTFPTKTFNQYTDSVIKIVASGVTNTRINGDPSGHDNNKYYGYLRTDKDKILSLSYTMVKTSGTFTEASNHPTPSDIVLTSGNIDFDVTSIRSSGAGTATYKLFIILKIHKVGIGDSVITINSNNIIS